jgi:UDP-N-acetylmuramoyl-tripeptide--D-alanyl-D-alanine ligase
MRVVTSTGAQVLGRPPFGAFLSVSTDTRTLEPGALFIALRGENFDGHRFLGKAEERGALAAIVDEAGIAEYPCDLPIYIVKDTLKAYGDLASGYRRQFSIPVVGITGTVGKTTTKDFTSAILGALGPVVATEANFNNDVGVPQTLFGITDNTAAAVVEMGMRGAGQIARLAAVAEPTCGIITTIGKTHSEFFADGEAGVARAKTELLWGLADGAPVGLPAESPWLESVLRPAAKGPVTTFGMAAGDVRAEDYRLVDGGAAFRIASPEGHVDVHLSAPGRHLALNAAAAFCTAIWHAVPLEAAAEALASVSLGKHRLQVHHAPGGWTVIDDSYNAGPESTRAALEVLHDWPAKRRFAVLGDMRELGPAAEAEHIALGVPAARTLDMLVTVGELASFIGEAAFDAGLSKWIHAADAGSAAEAVESLLREGDVVLVKGSRALALEHAVEGLVQ